MKVQLQNNWVEGQHARWPRLAIGFCIIIRSCVIIFTSLGKVALWEDEALTALIAQGVWRTGDTSAVVGHNIVAYRGGILLRGLYDRSAPPLPSYLASPFIGLLGASSWAARLPFAICGLLGVIAILRWLYRTSEPPAVWCVVGMAVLGNGHSSRISTGFSCNSP